MSEAARQHACTGPVVCRRCGAAYLGVSVDTIDDVVRKQLPTVKVGNRVLLARADLDGYIAARKERPEWADPPSPPSSNAPESGTIASPPAAGASVARRA